MRKWLLGLLTLWPFLYVALLLGMFVISFLGLEHRGPGDDPFTVRGDLFPVPFEAIFGVHIGTFLLVAGLMVVYAVAALRNAELSDGLRIWWLLLIVLGTFLFLPVYWWMYVRPSRRPAERSSTSRGRNSAVPCDDERDVLARARTPRPPV